MRGENAQIESFPFCSGWSRYFVLICYEEHVIKNHAAGGDGNGEPASP